MAAQYLPGVTPFADPLTTVGGNSAAYGSIPTIPSPTATAGQSIAGNTGNLGSLYGLATGTGQASGAGAAAQYNTLLPGLSGLESQASGDITQELSGQLPQDVMNQIEQSAAERGIATGSPGSDNSNAAMLKALGLTSLGMEQTGQQALGQLIGETPTGPAFNPATQQPTAGDQQSAAGANAIYQSAPNPTAAAKANLAATGAGLAGGMGAARGPSQGALPAPTTTSPAGPGGGLGPFDTSTGTGGSLSSLYNLPTGDTYGNVTPGDEDLNAWMMQQFGTTDLGEQGSPAAQQQADPIQQIYSDLGFDSGDEG